MAEFAMAIRVREDDKLVDKDEQPVLEQAAGKLRAKRAAEATARANPAPAPGMGKR
jgi:hypothetical protein